MITISEFLTRVRRKSATDLVQTAPRYARAWLERRAVAMVYWSHRHATSTARKRRRQKAGRLLRDADEVLFLCHGNICRSPFAERYARMRLDARGIETIDVASAGFVEMNDPHSPANAQKAAEIYDVDLTDHRSVKATAEAVNSADLIRLKSYRNFHNFTTRFPEAADRMILLRVFESGRTMQIPDPHGHCQSVFSSAYADIATCIHSLLDEYERGYPPVQSQGRPGG